MTCQSARAVNAAAQRKVMTRSRRMSASVRWVERRVGRKVSKKPRGRRTGPSSRLPKKSIGYFFFDDFFAAFLAGAFFLAAIELTTFHAVRDLPVAPTWQKTPDCSGKPECDERGEVGRQP